MHNLPGQLKQMNGGAGLERDGKPPTKKKKKKISKSYKGQIAVIHDHQCSKGTKYIQEYLQSKDSSRRAFLVE